jgi:hypothetical protein
MIKEVDALRSTDCRLCKARTMKFSLVKLLKSKYFMKLASSWNYFSRSRRRNQWTYWLRQTRSILPPFVLWDNSKQNCRCLPHGLGSEIYPKYGINGFTSTTCSVWTRIIWYDAQIDRDGRAFIIKEYQQNQCHFSCCGRESCIPFALSRTQILLGGVSISNQFSDFSKSLMIHEIELLRSVYWQYIHPKKAYKVKLKDAERFFF